MDRAATPFGGPMSDGRGRRRVSRGDHAELAPPMLHRAILAPEFGLTLNLGGVYWQRNRNKQPEPCGATKGDGCEPTS